MLGKRAPISACSIVRYLGFSFGLFAALLADVRSTYAVIAIFDGFGDADRNNNGVIEFYDTDVNNSGTWNDPTDDADQISRNFLEVTAATDPSDVGIIWSGIRSFDSPANDPKTNTKIINDSVVTGTETSTEIHNHGLALGVESKGGSSRLMGRFAQSVDLGASAGDKLVVSVDFRVWKEADNPDPQETFNELRWGLFEDTDSELGATAPYGSGYNGGAGTGANVVWGRDDGDFYKQEAGAEGDKGIHTRLSFGSLAAATDSRINWEYNLKNINGSTNPGEILAGSGVTNTPGGGDVGTVATPVGGADGIGGVIQLGTYAPHTLAMELTRLADGRVDVAAFVDGVEILRDDIKTTDTGYNVIGPPATSFDYVAFHNQTSDFDYVLDNFKIELIGSVPGDFNGNNFVDAADYVLWRQNVQPLPANEVSTIGTTDAQDYTDWRARFGNPTAGGGGGDFGSTVPEPAGAVLLMIGGLLCGAWFKRPIVRSA